MINNYDLLLVLLEKIHEINTYRTTHLVYSREEFACNDLYIKFKLSNGCTCRRIPDMQLLSSLFKHNKVDNNLEVRVLIM